MVNRFKVGIAALALSMGLAGAPALAHGLVDVNIGNVNILNNVGIGVAAAAVVQLCGLQAQVGVIASQIAQGTFPGCTGTATTGPNAGLTGPVSVTNN